VPDAVRVVTKRLKREDLKKSGVDEQMIEDIFSVTKYVHKFFDFEQVISLGLTVGIKDLSYDKALFFAWIKQGKSG